MGTRERPADRGRRRARDALVRLGREFRDARISAGLSLRAVSLAAGVSRSQIWRLERGECESVSVAIAGCFAVVGRELSFKAYPVGDPVRDRGHRALLERLHSRVHPSLEWREEVPFPIQQDLRAWDAVIGGRAPEWWRTRVEAETNVADTQALERRLRLKTRDDPVGHLILLVSDTRTNRHAVPALRRGLRDLLPCESGDILAALKAGREPPGGGVLLL
jgi:transcriptional regulator with XRE-family HTH domain